MLVSLQAASSTDFGPAKLLRNQHQCTQGVVTGRYEVYSLRSSVAICTDSARLYARQPSSSKSCQRAKRRTHRRQQTKNMNNQGWPNERCEACGLRAKLNMGAGANAPLYIRLRPCARCKEVRYCNRECQRKDWPRHRKNCVVPGDKPPPPMDKICEWPSRARSSKGAVILWRERHKADLKDDDIIQLHTIGFHEHDAPELAIPRLPHRLLQRAGGLLAYVRNEKPVDQPLKEGEKVSVNGLHFTASHVKGQRLKDANFLGLVAVRAYYALKQSDGLVRCIELTFESEDEMNDDLKGDGARRGGREA